MSAYLYYRRHSPVLSDGEYDFLCKAVAKRWDKLDWFLQWQLGNPEAILATGHQVKVTVQAEHAAIAWFRSVNNCLPHGDGIEEWNYDEFRDVRWVAAEG